MTLKKRFILLPLLLIGLVVTAYYIIFEGSQRNIANEEATLILEASELYAPFKSGQNELTTSYIDQVTRITGTLTNVTKYTLELDYKVQVDLADSLAHKLGSGTKITIKGRCVGYDDLLEVVKMDQAIILP